MMDLAARGQAIDEDSGTPASPVISLDAIRSNIQNLHNPAVQRAMLTAIDSAQGDLNKAQANIEAWFNSGMDRVSGWYKRKTQWILFWIGLVLAVGLNINTLTIADHLYQNEAARTQLADRATRSVQPTALPTVAGGATPSQTDPVPAGNPQQQPIPTAAQAVDEFEKMNLPIGWSNWSRPKNTQWFSWIILAFGWLLTAFAASMGAPFGISNKVTVYPLDRQTP